jgi:hypothetical protein
MSGAATRGLARDDSPQALRDDLITHLFCTSPDRARLVAELSERNPGMGALPADLGGQRRPAGSVRDRAPDRSGSN